MGYRTGNLLLFLGACVLSLLIGEMLCRLVLDPPQRVELSVAPIVKSASAPVQALQLRAHPDEGGLYRGSPTGKRLNPNRHVIIENHRLSQQRVEFHTNSLGFRNPEIGEKRGTRILFLGDSVTFQDFLNEEDTFVRRVETKARSEGKNWETINAGVGAISLKTELAILVETGLGLKPDVVVLGFYLNDFQDSRGVTLSPLPDWLQQSWLASHTAFLLATLWVESPAEADRARLARWRSDFITERPVAEGFFNQSPQAFNKLLLDSFGDYGAAWSPHSWEEMWPLFVELKRLSQQHHFQLMIVGFPVYPQVYASFLDDYPQQQLLRIGNSLDIPVLDLLPALRAAAQQQDSATVYAANVIHHELFYDQCHHTPAGSALVAGELYQFLAKQVQD